MQSDLADKILSKKIPKNSIFDVHSPYLAINLSKDKLSYCRNCNAYYCNCEGKSLQDYKVNKEIIKSFEVHDIYRENSAFILSGLGEDNKRIEIKCTYLIFACGPIASPTLLKNLCKLPKKINLNHNGLFSFPFFSLYKIKLKQLALTNLYNSIFKSSKNP